MLEDQRHLARYYLWRWLWEPIGSRLFRLLIEPLNQVNNGVRKLSREQNETNRLLRLIVHEQETGGVMTEIERVEQSIDVLCSRIQQEGAVGKYARSRCQCGRDYTRFGDCAACLREQVRELHRRRRELINEARRVKTQ